MQITVSGKHLDVGTSLHEYVKNDLSEIVAKYFEHAVSASVIFSKERHLFCANIMVNEGTGNHVIIKADAQDDDIYVAFDKAGEKIKNRLARYKGRIKNHHKDSLKQSIIDATQYILSTKEEDHDSDEDKQSPLIIAENQTHLEHLTVSDAVMKIDLKELPALMFINKKNGRINMIYRRNDGNISWIDPANIEKTAAAA